MLGNRQFTHDLVRTDIDLQIIQYFLCFLLHGTVVKRYLTPLFPAQEHVFRNGQVFAHIQFLMDDRNARFLRLLRRQIAVLPAENLQRTFISCVDAAQHLHER